MFLIMFKTGQAEPLVLTRIPRPRSSRGERAEQPRSMSSLRPQSRPVRALDSIANGAQTETGRVREQSTTTDANSSQSRIVRDPRQAMPCLSRRIRVSFMRPMSFPVRIQIIPAYVLI